MLEKRSDIIIRKRRILIRYMAGMILLFAGCGAVEIDSRWIDHKMTIDGRRDNDWEGVMLKINDQPVGIGFRNDDDYLYILMTTYDRDLLREIFKGGLTIWLDSSGGNDQTLGIHYPLMAGHKEQSEQLGMRDGNIRGEFDRLEKIPFNVTDMEITIPSSEKRLRANVNQLKQLGAGMDISGGNLTYELRVPLREMGSEPYFIGTKAGGTIGFGIETSVQIHERPAEFERRRQDAEELPVGLRDDAPGMNRSVTAGGIEDLKPISFRAKIRLAGGPAEVMR